ncbi:MAG: hypothetical protein HFI07_08070 [Lachnospiraceae bacterium]|nr:hypothetical protein [Lachnospiraceae bacterium]
MIYCGGEPDARRERSEGPDGKGARRMGWQYPCGPSLLSRPGWLWDREGKKSHDE